MKIIQDGGQLALSNLQERIQEEDVINDLTEHCGREYDALEVLLAEMKTIFEVIAEAIDRTMDLISCQRIVPIYHLVVYDGACQYSMSAVFWVFVSALIMGTFGLVMILFRAAYKPTIYKNPAVENKEVHR